MSNSYIIQLSNNKQLTISSEVAQYYPTIQDIIEYIEDVDAPIPLIYDDSDALYQVLTTQYIKKEHQLDEYIRLIKAVDFLGNHEVMVNMAKTLRHMFESPQEIESFKPHKDIIKSLILSLPITVLDEFYREHSTVSRVFNIKFYENIYTLVDNMLISNPNIILFSENFTLFVLIKELSFDKLRYYKENKNLVPERELVFYIYDPQSPTLFIEQNITVSISDDIILVLSKVDNNGNIYGKDEKSNSIVILRNQQYRMFENIHKIPANMEFRRFSLDLRRYITHDDNSYYIWDLQTGLLVDKYTSTKTHFIFSPLELFNNISGSQHSTAFIDTKHISDPDDGYYLLHNVGGDTIKIKVDSRAIGIRIEEYIIKGAKLNPFRNYLLFSYDENIFAEIILISKMKTNSDWGIWYRKREGLQYNIRILNRNGIVLDEKVLIDEAPVAVSNNYLLTVNMKNVEGPTTANRSLPNSTLIYVRTIHDFETSQRLKLSDMSESLISKKLSKIEEVVNHQLMRVRVGENDSFLFIYESGKEYIYEKIIFYRKTAELYMDEVLD